MRKCNPTRLVLWFPSWLDSTLQSLTFSAKITAPWLPWGRVLSVRGDVPGEACPELCLPRPSLASALGCPCWQSLFGLLIAQFQGASRTPWSMAEDGRLVKGQVIFWSADYMVSVAATQLCSCSVKTATDNLWMNGQSSISVILDLQNQGAGCRQLASALWQAKGWHAQK